jgi:hypothetical protein
MEDKKIYLLAELTIHPGFLQEVKAILKEALTPTLPETDRKRIGSRNHLGGIYD